MENNEHEHPDLPGLRKAFDYLFICAKKSEQIFHMLHKYNLLGYLSALVWKVIRKYTDMPELLDTHRDVQVNLDIIKLSFQVYSNVWNPLHYKLDIPEEDGAYKFVVVWEHGEYKHDMWSNVVLHADVWEYHKDVRARTAAHQVLDYGWGRVAVDHSKKTLHFYWYSSWFGKANNALVAAIAAQIRAQSSVQYPGYTVTIEMWEWY